MNSISSRGRRTALGWAAAIAITVGVALAGVQAGPARGQEAMPSPGVFASVVVETSRVGWPHLASYAERDEISRRVIRTNVPVGRPGNVRCEWPTGYVGRVVCTTRILPRFSNRRPVRVIVSRLRVFEDGSWRQTRIR